MGKSENDSPWAACGRLASNLLGVVVDVRPLPNAVPVHSLPWDIHSDCCWVDNGTFGIPPRFFLGLHDHRISLDGSTSGEGHKISSHGSSVHRLHVHAGNHAIPSFEWAGVTSRVSLDFGNIPRSSIQEINKK